MDTREWFEGVLGWEYGLTGFGQPVWVSPEGEQVYINPPPILEEQEAWIQYVVTPMREMGYEYYVDSEAEAFYWIHRRCENDNKEIYVELLSADNIFQASLDAAEQCPEVKEKLTAYRGRDKINQG